MRCLVCILLAGTWLAAWAEPAAAQVRRPRDSDQTGSGSAGDRSGSTGIPHVPGNEQFKAHDAAVSRHQTRRPHYGLRGSSHHTHRGLFYPGGNSYSFYYGSGYIYAPYADPYAVGAFDPYWSGPLILPPLVIPAETMFGPQVARNMLGPDLPTPNIVPRAPRVRGPVEVKVTNAEVKARAGRFMEAGDTHFKAQKFREAAERYRTAAQTAPDMPVALLRQGFTFVAMSQYESAAKAFRRALQVRADWADADPFLMQLYGENAVSKAAHLEALAKAVEANEQDGDLMLVLAMELHFDGQRERSVPFFERCAQLGDNEDHLLDAFLPPGKAAQGRAGEF